MKKFKRVLLYFITILLGLYAFAVTLIYFFQEKLLFHPEVLSKDYLSETLSPKVEEIKIQVDKDMSLHGLLSKVQKPKGLVFYLHGNGGSAYSWSRSTAKVFNSLNYDLFILDYRGYGKSDGHIISEAQINEDVQKAYNVMLKKYTANNIIIAGYSIGTGPAAYLAAYNQPKALLLQAPYYSLSKLTDEKIPLIPDFVKRYKFDTKDVIGQVKAPVYLFHGLDDTLIPYHHSEVLKKDYCPDAILIPLPLTGHNGINEDYIFMEKLEKLLQ